MTLLGRSLSRDTTYYTIAMASIFPLGIASALVTTEYLAPAEYGHLGLLMLVAGLLTTVYGFGIIQGTLMWAYGAAGDSGDEDGGGEDLGPAEAPAAALRQERRRVVGSGLTLACIIACIGTTALIAAADPLSHLIAGSDALRVGVIWTAISAGLGSLWRVALQVHRMERRAVMYLMVSVSRPLFALVFTVAFLSRGYGLAGAVAATAIGTALSLALALGAALPCFAVGLRPSDFAEIFRRGRGYIPMIAAIWIVMNADLWVLSRFAPAVEVGLYRLASRFGVFPSYVTSAYLMAWVPIQRSALFKAAARARSEVAVTSTMFSYFCIGSVGILVLLTACSKLFIGLAPASYQGAAPYVPAVAAAIVAQGFSYALYRISRFPYRRLMHVLMVLLAAVVLSFLGSVLAGPLGGYGVALAGVVGSLMGAAGLVVAISRSNKPIPFEWGKIARAVAVGCLCVALLVASPAEGVLRVAVELAVLVGFPFLLLAARVIAPAVARDLLSVMRAALPLRAGTRTLLRRTESLAAERREAIEQWIGTGVGPSVPTLQVEARDRDSLTALTRGLRELIAYGQPSERDAEIGAYLTHRGSLIDRDLLAEELVAAGSDPLELHLLDDAYQTLRQARRRLARRGRRAQSNEAAPTVISR